MNIEIRKDGSLIEGYPLRYYWCFGGCCSGDTPTPPGPEPPDTGTVISSITIVVADVITNSGKASAIFTPASADTLFVYSSLNSDLATIDRSTGEIVVNANGFVTFCVEDLYSGLEDCKTVEVIKEEEPGPDTGDTGITSITIIVADTITDSGFASAVFEPSYEEVVFYYTSSDPSYATIDSTTGEITVLKDGVVEFCVEDLLSGLKDCKNVNVKKTVEPGPEPPDPPYTGFTGCTSEIRIKAVYNVKTTTGYTILYASSSYDVVNGSSIIYKNWVTKVELEDGTDITSGIVEIKNNTSGAKHKCYKFSETGDTAVYLTTNLTKLGYAFYHTPDMVSVEIPCNIDVIGNGTFESCSSLKSIIVYSNDTQIISDIITLPQNQLSGFTFTGKVYRNKMTRDEIDEAYGEKIIDSGNNGRFYTFEQMLYNANSLAEINGPAASGDKKLLIADDGTIVAAAKGISAQYDIPSGVTRIGTMVFSKFNELEAVTFPDTLKSIGWEAFNSDASLTNVVIPGSVEDIAEGAFAGCSSLSSVTLNEGLVNIGRAAFNRCPITEITIPDSVTGFGIVMESLVIPLDLPLQESDVFYLCTNLTSVTFGSGITKVVDRFSSASTLNTITAKSAVAPELGENAFNGIKNNGGTLYYPAGSDYSTWLSRLNTWTGQEINDI